jgi:hypothetical protein
MSGLSRSIDFRSCVRTPRRKTWPLLPTLSTSKQPFDMPCRVNDPHDFNAITEWIIENDVAVGCKDAQSRSKVFSQLSHERLSGQECELPVKPPKLIARCNGTVLLDPDIIPDGLEIGQGLRRDDVAAYLTFLHCWRRCIPSA